MKKTTKKLTTKKFALKNGVNIIYAVSEKQIRRKGLIYVHGMTVMGTKKAPVTIVYNQADGMVVRVTAEKAAGKELAALAYAGIKMTSGTWMDMTKKPRKIVNTWVRMHGYMPVRKNKAHVYFWRRRVFDENGNLIGIRHCHSHQLIEADPMGQKLMADWKNDPEAFMNARPELCRGRS